MNQSKNTEAYEALAALLKRKRQEKGITIRGLASAWNVPHSIVAKIETAKRKIDSVELVEYCELLGIDPNDCLLEVKAALQGKDIN